MLKRGILPLSDRKRGQNERTCHPSQTTNTTHNRKTKTQRPALGSTTKLPTVNKSALQEKLPRSMHMRRSILLFSCGLLMEVLACAHAFQVIQTINGAPPTRSVLSHNGHRIHSRWSSRLGEGENDSEIMVSTSNDEAKDNFDGAGFAGYLAPYALALLASVGVTFGFMSWLLQGYN